MKGQGHTVTKIVTVAHVLYCIFQYAAMLHAAVAGVGLHVNMNAYVFYLLLHLVDIQSTSIALCEKLVSISIMPIWQIGILTTNSL